MKALNRWLEESKKKIIDKYASGEANKREIKCQIYKTNYSGQSYRYCSNPLRRNRMSPKIHNLTLKPENLLNTKEFSSTNRDMKIKQKSKRLFS